MINHEQNLNTNVVYGEFRKAFFKNEGLVEQHDDEIVEQEIEQSEGGVNTDITFDDLFK